MALKTNYIKHEGELYEVIPPTPTETERGGIIASPKKASDTTEVRLGADGKLYVNGSGGSGGGQITVEPQPTTKAYVTGTTSPEGSSELIFDEDVYLDKVAGRLHVTSLQLGNTILNWSTDEQCIQITFVEESADGGE